MMYNFNPLHQWQPEPDLMKGLSDDDRLKVAICQLVGYLFAVIIAFGICALFTGCASPRIVEEHHHHYEADTAAVHALVDSRMTSWHEESEAWIRQAFSEQSASRSSHEDEQETISELITVSTDSVGRTLRTEQRTISRSLTRELQQQEQRITQEYEASLRVVVDSLDDIYHRRFDSLAAHVQQQDSTSSIIHHPSSIDHRPWYQRWWDNLQSIALIFLLIHAVLWFTRRIWWPLLFSLWKS